MKIMKKAPRRLINLLLMSCMIFALITPIKSMAAYSVNNYIAKWEGEYAGSTGSTAVMRHFILVLDSYTPDSNGKYTVSGTFSFSASHDTAQAAISSDKGSYKMRGTADPSTGSISSLTGYEWIDYPGDFDYITFNGSFVSAGRMEGKTDNGDFYCNKIASISESLSILMTLKGETKTTNLISTAYSFKKGSNNICTIVASNPSSWGGAQYGAADLVQGSKVIMSSKTGSFVDIVPGQQMEAGTPVKVVFKDSTGKAVKTVTTKLKIVAATVKAPQKTKITSATVYFGSKYNLLVYWSKKTCDGYQVQVAKNPNFTKNSLRASGYVSAKDSSGKDGNYAYIKKLPKNTNLYIRVRCYNKSGKTYKYSAWSPVRGIMIRK